MPKISPFSMEKLMFLAASTVPFFVEKLLQSFRLVSSVPFACFLPSLCYNFIYSASSAILSSSASAVHPSASALSESARFFKRYNCSVICLINVIFDLVRFQYIYQSFDCFAVFVTFFYCNDVYICFCCFRIRCLMCNGIFGYGISCLQCIVSVQYNKCNFIFTRETCAASSSSIWMFFGFSSISFTVASSPAPSFRVITPLS